MIPYFVSLEDRLKEYQADFNVRPTKGLLTAAIDFEQLIKRFLRLHGNLGGASYKNKMARDIDKRSNWGALVGNDLKKHAGKHQGRVPKQFVDRVKEIKDWRNYLAHGNNRKPPSLKEEEAFNLLIETIKILFEVTEESGRDLTQKIYKRKLGKLESS